MNKMQTQVREFHDAFGVPVNNKPVTEMSYERRILRAKLILEEAYETVNALGFSLEHFSGDFELREVDGYEFDLAEIADGLTDLKYVTFGADIELGLDAQQCFDLISAANMSKLWTKSEVRSDRALNACNDDRRVVKALPNAERCYVVKRGDGKIQKPPSFSHPDLREEIERQRSLGTSDNEKNEGNERK